MRCSIVSNNRATQERFDRVQERAELSVANRVSRVTNAGESVDDEQRHDGYQSRVIDSLYTTFGP